MMHTTNDFRLPVNHWLPRDQIEDGAWRQIGGVADHPEAVDHVAVMPDTHQGYGVAIGTAFVTEGSVIPNAVGVDIGCGVALLKTGLRVAPREEWTEFDETFWREFAAGVRARVPTGFAFHHDTTDILIPESIRHHEFHAPVNEVADYKLKEQFGTLGGGNHFLEAATDDEGNIFFLAHSGSRGMGFAIAEQHQARAVEQSIKRKLEVAPDLASLRLDSGQGQAYLHDMRWAINYARENRKQMLYEMLDALLDVIGRRDLDVEVMGDAKVAINALVDNDYVDTPHNFATVTMDDNRVLHRKGATVADMFGFSVIPGTMGSPSYLVKNIAPREAWWSVSHGAGRVMSRMQARKTIASTEFRDAMIGTYTVVDMRNVDEAPLAYKDIDQVIAQQADLLQVVTRLTPIITVKGDSRARDD